MQLCGFFYTGAHHWICTARWTTGPVQLYDSRAIVSDPMTPEVELQLSKLFSPPQSKSSLRIEIQPVQQQEGVHDCGLFSIACATEVCVGVKPESVQFDRPIMKQHLITCLEKRYFQPFPKFTGIESVPRPTRQFTRIKLYCTCHMPECYDTRMIACDKCNKWYHFSCVLKAKKTPTYWLCNICSCI